MADPLSSMKRKLDIPNAFLRRVAVAALFAKAATDKKISTDSHKEAILLCLTHPSQVVVEEGVSQLSSAPGITRQNAMALILAALPSAPDSSCAGILMKGLLELWWLQIEAGDKLPQLPSPFTDQHILVAAISLQPAVQSVLLHSLFTHMLGAVTSSKDGVNSIKKVWENVKGFLEWGLTWRKKVTRESPETADNNLILRTEILNLLMKLSCNITEWRGIFLPLMVRYVGLIPLVSTAACSFAALTINGTAEVIEAELEESSMNDEHFQLLISRFMTISLQYCHGALSKGMGIEGTISSIRHIARIAHEDGFAEANAPFLPFLGFLCMRTSGHTRHMILGTICEAVKGKYLETRCIPPPYLPGLLLLPALQATTLRSSSIDQKWGPHLMDLISRMLASPSVQEDQADLSSWNGRFGVMFTGELGLLEQGIRILCRLWWRVGETGDLLCWLKSLSASFKGAVIKKKEAEKQPFSAEDNQKDDDQCDSSSVFSLVLCSLLTHSSPIALHSAAEVLEKFLVLIPTEAPSFLPVVLFQLQRLSSSPSLESAAAELSLLQSMRSMCGHPHVMPWVLKTLQTLMEEGSPELVRCASLRTLCSCWLQYGVGWKYIQGILGGLIQSKSESDKLIQVALGGCLRDICKRESAAGLEFIAGIQQCMLDTDPCVNALGLTCINMMCEQDILDFYKAWRVVQRWHPKIPSDNIIACEWVQLIGYGALDAHVNPDKVEAILSILWSAVRHSNSETRKKVYQSLTSYTPEILEPLEQLTPLIDYVQLLLTEKDSLARLSAEEAVMMALDYEHSQRRRFLAGKTAQRQQSGPRSAKSQIAHQLSTVLPARVCSGLDGDDQGFASSGSFPFKSSPLPGALLICYSPKASITGEALGPKYRDVFLSLCDSLAWSGWTHPYMALSAWKEFIIRWLGAISSVPDPIWDAIRQVWSRGLAPSAGNSLLAAGALCLTGKMSEAHLKWLVEESKYQLQFGSSSTVTCCAAHVLSVCGSALHSADWKGRLDIASQLQAAMGSTESGIVMSGCAEALGMIAMGIVHDEFLLKRPGTSTFLSDSMSFLVSCLIGLCPDVEYLQGKIFASWPDTLAPLKACENIWKGHMFQDLGTALSGVCGAISIMGCAVLKAGDTEFPIKLASEMVAFLERISIVDGLLIGAFKGLVHLLPCLSRFQANCDTVLEASLEAAWNLADNSALSQGVRAWAAFGIGSFCTALLDRADDVRSSSKKIPTYARNLIKLVEAATGETETCCGGLMGLGAMIGGITLPCRELDEAGPSNISINLLTSPTKHLVNLATEVAGTLTSDFIDPRASSLGRWVSIAAGHLHKKAVSSTPASTGAASALASYPTDGAMRPLVEQCLAILESVSNATGTVLSVSTNTAPGTKSSNLGNQAPGNTSTVLTFPLANQMGILVSVVRCIRQAKRVPLLHWGAVCNQILEVCRSGGEGCEELEVEAIGLCLTHARTPSLGLKEVLEGLFMPHAFAQLSQSAKKSILERLASVVAALPAAHVPRILKQLPSMVQVGDGKWSLMSMELLVSAWVGLEAAIHWGPEIGKKSSEVSNSLIAAAGDLLRVMPIPNRVYPGDLYAIGNMVGSSINGLGADDSSLSERNVWRTWRTATSCFKALKGPEVLQLTKMEGSPSSCIQSMLMRSLLVWTGGLTTRDLAPCRYFCMDQDIHNSHTILSLAYLDAPTTLQHQLLTEILEVVKECKYPLVAFDLVRKLAAVWYSGSSENSPGNMHIALCDSLPENHNFPSIFASFLAASSMTPYIRPIVGILYTLLDSAEENSNMVEWQEIRATVCECLRAICHKVDDDVLMAITKQWTWQV